MSKEIKSAVALDSPQLTVAMLYLQNRKYDAATIKQVKQAAKDDGKSYVQRLILDGYGEVITTPKQKPVMVAYIYSKLCALVRNTPFDLEQFEPAKVD